MVNLEENHRKLSVGSFLDLVVESVIQAKEDQACANKVLKF